MLKGFAYHGVTVSDLDRSVAFYRDLLHMKLERTFEVAGEGLEEATGLSGAHMKVAMLSFKDPLGDHILKLIQYLSPQGKKRFEARLCDVGASHLAIYVDHLEELYKDLSAKGLNSVSPPVRPMPEHPERMFTYLLDPDGIFIELTRVPCHHAHVISELDKAVAFYRDVLGMKLGFTVDITGQGIAAGTGFPGAYLRGGRMVLDTDEYVELHHYVRPEGKKRSEIKLCDVGCTHVAFDVDDVQQSYRELQAKGAKFISRPVREEAGGQKATMVYMLDQDDYVVELRSGPTY